MKHVQRWSVCLVLLLAGLVRGQTVLTIDDFEYSDEAAVRDAWHPAEGSSPVGLQKVVGGSTALKIPCDFGPGGREVMIYDRSVSLDLQDFQTIQFDVYVSNPILVREVRLYLRSGAGEYVRQLGPWSEVKYHPTTVLPRGWKRVRMSLRQLDAVGQPAGRDKIDGVRFWVSKGNEEKGVCLIDNLQVFRSDIAIIAEGRSGGIANVLEDKFGLSVERISERRPARGGLDGKKLAIVWNIPEMESDQIDRIKDFVKQGGRIIIVGGTPAPLAELVGVNKLGSLPPERDGQFSRIVFEKADIPGLPDMIGQAEKDEIKQVFVPVQIDKEARVLGTWRDNEGKIGTPAVVLSRNGAYIGHELVRHGNDAVSLFILSLTGHFVPSVWDQAVDYVQAKALRVGPFRDWQSLMDDLKARPLDEKRREKVEGYLADARTLKGKIDQALKERNYAEIFAKLQPLHDRLVEAYTSAQKPGDGELRGVWIGSDKGYDWDEACRLLAAANFNAIFPYMCSGGMALYDSKVLPKRGDTDQLAACVAAAHKYGLEVHPWKIDFFMESASEEFMNKMREAGRGMRTYKDWDLLPNVTRGVGTWLCPSNPENFALERDAMLEMVKNYDIDGVHFDYIRYEYHRTCYCDGCRQRFEAYRKAKVSNWPDDCFGDGPLAKEYRQWRVQQISRLVQTVSQEAHKIKPYIKISAAVFSRYPQSVDEVGQDWVEWVRQGWVDFLCPMTYRSGDTDFMRMTAFHVGLIRGKVPLYEGIGHWTIPVDQEVGQIGIARQMGADGFVSFAFNRYMAEKYLPVLAESLMSEKATLPHQGPDVEFSSAIDNDWPVVTCGADSLSMQVRTVSLGAHRIPATAVGGKIEIQDPDGKTLGVLATLPPVGRTLTVSVNRRAGTFQLAAVGELTFEDGSKRTFIRRSRPYRFLEAGDCPR